MTENSATLSERLSSLESSMDALTDRVCRIRMDDFKRVVIGEIIEVLREEGDRLLQKGEAMEGFDLCRNRDYCHEAMDDAIRLAIDCFYRRGPASAIEILSEFQERIEESGSCDSRDCQEFAVSVLGDAITSLGIAQRLQERMEAMGVVSADPPQHRIHDGMVDILALLANGHRLRILECLYESEKCFSDLSAATGLRTGHLQFHIQSLQDRGAVRRTPIRGVYAITIMGMTALEGLWEFDSRLEALRVGGEVKV